MIQKPYGINIKDQVIDGNKNYILKWKTSGDTSASFSISIYNNSDGTLTWSLPRTYSFALSFNIPATIIPNGADYKISITVWNSSNQSATSQFVVFEASSTPIVTIAPLGTIGNHSYLFTASYSQIENVPLKMYTVNLYNADKKLIKTSGIKTDGLLEHRFELMKNGETYFVEFAVTSKKDLTIYSSLIEFNVIYDNPNMYYTIEAENITEKASIKLKWKLSQVIGKTSIAPVYLEDTKLDVRTGRVIFDEGFEISSDFTLKVWFEESVKNVDLIYLSGSNGTIRVKYEDDNRFHLYKSANGFTTHYMTELAVGDEIFLCVQSIGGRMNFISEVIA